MTFDVVQRRLQNQRLADSSFESAVEVVRWMGAVQSQEYEAALWALGQRVPEATLTDVERAFADGEFLRTHLMRPTWHFVAREDIRWLLALTAPRLRANDRHRMRELELDDTLLDRAGDVIANALQGGGSLTRAELGTALRQAGIEASGPRLAHIAYHAELRGIVCSGPPRGKQQTYALLDERAPDSRLLAREEALAELALRYFRSHGPATIQDFVWWSGLVTADARAGLEAVKDKLASEVVGKQTYWFAPSDPPAPNGQPAAHLLPSFDEFTVAYRDRSALVDGALDGQLDPRSPILLNNILTIDGRAAGTWKRTARKNEAFLEVTPLRALVDGEQQAVTDAARRYSAFLAMPVTLV